MSSQPDVSVVILCYKAGEHVHERTAEMKRLLEKRGVTFEIVLVGNFNRHERDTDQTPRFVREEADSDERVHALTDEKQGMFGWDVRQGLAQARGRYIAFIDGDGQNPFEDIIRCYDAMLDGHADMALPFRVTRNDGLNRILISRIFNMLTRALFPRVDVYDINAKPKMFTREALSRLQLKSNDWFVDAEIILQATKGSFRIRQFPTVFLRNQKRSSFVNVTTLFEFMINLVTYRLFGRVR